MTQTLVYVSCAESREINVFTLDPASGEIRLRQKVPAEGAAQPLRVSPDKRLLYVGTRSENAILSFAIDPASGTLRAAGRSPVPGSPTYLSCDHAMRVLFAAYYHNSALVAYPLDEHSVPQAATQEETDLPRAHCARMDASNRWLLVPTLGADAIRIYRLGDDLRLTPNDPALVGVRPGSGPRHLLFSPDNRQVYCLNELAGDIDRFAFDATSGTLTLKQSVSLLPPGFADKPWAAELCLTPDGRFLYASERRSSQIAVFAVGAESEQLERPEPFEPLQHPGHLSLLGHYPTETQPRGMAIDPSGLWLIATGELSGHLTVYALDPETGHLTAVQRHATGLNPICVEIVDLP